MDGKEGDKGFRACGGGLQPCAKFAARYFVHTFPAAIHSSVHVFPTKCEISVSSPTHVDERLVGFLLLVRDVNRRSQLLVPLVEVRRRHHVPLPKRKQKVVKGVGCRDRRFVLKVACSGCWMVVFAAAHGRQRNT